MMTPDQFAMMMGQSGLIKAQFDYPELEPQPAPGRRARQWTLALRRTGAAVLTGAAAALVDAAARVSPAPRAAGAEQGAKASVLDCVGGVPVARASS